MSKKLYSTQPWKARLAKALGRELSKKQRRRTVGTPEQVRRNYQRPRLGTATLVLPTVFSVLRNPEESIEFLAQVELTARSYHINFDLGAISQITIEALTALGAMVRKLRQSGRISGNLPTDEGCRNILVQSGFLEHVYHARPLPKADHGKMSHKESKKVEVKLAAQLVHAVTTTLFGSSKPCPPAYRALIECMSNTRDHAAGDRVETETWWATSYADTVNKKGCFAFLDTGVGIFKSVRLGTIRRAYRAVSKALGIRDDRDILKEILHGEVASRTGLDYRGKGLPSMYNALRAGRLKSLVIISNRVYADVGQSDFRSLNNEFPLLTLSSILRVAKSWDYACGSFKLADITMPREGIRKEQRCLTDEEVGKIIAAAPEPFGTILAVTSVLGLRIGETLALRIGDVDFAKHVIRIRQSVDAATRIPQAVKSQASSADVPMPSQLAARLRALVKKHDGKSELLFVNRRGRPFSANKLREKQLHPLLVKLGIPRGGFHSMRHGAASALLADGATPAVVQRQLRHSDARITLGLYGHVVGDQQRNAVENRSTRIEQFAVN